jgi:hypothetical protein
MEIRSRFSNSWKGETQATNNFGCFAERYCLYWCTCYVQNTSRRSAPFQGQHFNCLEVLDLVGSH